jgi:GT2 family glycosyltransferase
LEPNEWTDSRIHILNSGKVGPAQKRDLGSQKANGEILVFLDDDSYPDSNLLTLAQKYFKDKEIVALGGPAITPKSNSFWQKVSGAVFLSKFSGGNPERYFPTGEMKEIYDWPSVNFMVRKVDFLNIGGFNSPYWPGEDTKLCLDLTLKVKKKILYIPQMIVWHHRRDGLVAHLKQIGAYGIHRGYFAKIFPQTSRKLIYFIPSLFLLFAFFSCFYFYFSSLLQIIILAGWFAYFFALLLAAIDITKKETFFIAMAALIYVFFTHLYYGLRFLQGLFTIKLTSRLR